MPSSCIDADVTRYKAMNCTGNKRNQCMFYTSAPRPGDGKGVKRDTGSWSGRSLMQLGRELNPGRLLLEPGLRRTPIIA